MSTRETVLCDVEISNWNGNRVICGKLSIGTCELCRRDMCDEHAMHPKGGVLLRADSVTPGTTGSQDVVYNPNSNTQIVPYPQVSMPTPMLRLKLCHGCRRGLHDHDIQEALDGVKDSFVQNLAAAISAKALETKPTLT